MKNAGRDTSAKISGNGATVGPGALPVTPAPRASEGQPSISKQRRNQTPGLLDAFTPEQRAQLIHWLVVDRFTYEKARQRIEKDFGITIRSIRPIYSFFHKYCEPFEAPAAQGTPLVDINVATANATVRIVVLPSGEVQTTKGEAK